MFLLKNKTKNILYFLGFDTTQIEEKEKME